MYRPRLETGIIRTQATSFTAAAIVFFPLKYTEQATKTCFTTTNMHSPRHAVEIASVYNTSRAFLSIIEPLEIE